MGAVSAHPRRNSPRAFALGSSRALPKALRPKAPRPCPPEPPDLDPDLNDTSPEHDPLPAATTPSDSPATSPNEALSPMNDADRELTHRGLLPAAPAPTSSAALLASAPPPEPGRLEGALLGAACGSALGRRVKGMRPEGIRHRFGWLTDLEPARGSAVCPQTDDSRTLALTLQACMAGADSPAQAFGERLVGQARALRHLGRASSEAIRRLSEGRRWWRAGTPSAGNGAALRAPAVGLAFGDDLERLRLEAARNAVVTHADRLAVASAIVVAHATALLARTPRGGLDATAFVDELIAGLGDLDDTWGRDRRSHAGKARVLLVDRLREVVGLLGRAPEEAFAVTQNGAFVLETLGAALWCFLQHPEDPERAIVTAVHGGFDADSVASLTGAFSGAYCGAQDLPRRWSRGLAGAREFRRLALRLSRPRQSEQASEGGGAAPRADRVQVTVLLDRSGSMGAIREDTIGGFNAFLADQRRLPGECRLSLVQFDTQSPQSVTVDAAPIAQAPELTVDTYSPRGGTPLLDALGMLLERLDEREESDPDEQQLVAVLTDGYENASRHFSGAQILEMVENRKAAGWAFVFLGANIDAFAEAGSLGLGRGSVGEWEHSRRGVRRSFAMMAESAEVYRGAGRERREEMACLLMDEVRERRSRRGADEAL